MRNTEKDRGAQKGHSKEPVISNFLFLYIFLSIYVSLLLGKKHLKLKTKTFAFAHHLGSGSSSASGPKSVVKNAIKLAKTGGTVSVNGDTPTKIVCKVRDVF